MSDIVERLRRWEDRRGHPTCGEMLDEASAEIARLRLTDDEREAIRRAIDVQEHRAADMHPRSWIAADIDDDCDTLRGLLERTKEGDR